MQWKPIASTASCSNGHAKGQASNVLALCTGSLIAPTVVVTARHCLRQMDGTITVQSPWVSSTWFTVRTSFSHASPRIDVGVVFLNNPINGPTYPKLATRDQQLSSHGVSVMGRISNGQVVTKGFAYTESDRPKYPSDSWQTTAVSGTADEYATGQYSGGEPGDSGGPCFQWSQPQSKGDVILYGVNVRGVLS